PLLADDSTRLVVWHQGGQARLLAAVNTNRSADEAAPCCLTIWEVTQASVGGSPNLTLLADTRHAGDTVYAMDMDGDGSEELAVLAPAAPVSSGEVSVLRW